MVRVRRPGSLGWRARRGLALSVAIAAALSTACGAPPPAAQARAPRQSRVVTPLPIPSTPGNGPALKAAACNNAVGSNCGSVGTLPSLEQASSLLNNYNGLTVPAVPFNQLMVSSWPLLQPIDWSNGGLGSGGFFGVNLATNKLFPRTDRNWGVLFAGYLKVPPSGSGLPVVKTFALASDDGARFAIGDGVQVQSTECNGARGMGVVCPGLPPFNTVKVVTFPANGGLFPFDLLWFQGRSGAALELSWADGDQSGSPPIFGAGPFTLVPADSFYSPEAKARLTVESSTPAVLPGSTLTYTVRLQNRGPVPLATWAFSVQVDPARLGALAPGAGARAFEADCAVNGSLLACAGRRILLPGESTSGSFTAVVAAGASNGSFIDVQGVVTALATEPELAAAVGGSGEVAAGEIYALTDDPYPSPGAGFDATDTGNTPAGFAATPGQGTAEDDPTRVEVGKPPAAPPLPSGPPDPSISDRLLAVSGTSALPQGTAIEVQVSGPTPGAGCAVTTSASGSWSCASLALADGSYAATANVVDASGSRGPLSGPWTFQVVSPHAPSIDTPAVGSTVNSSLVILLGHSDEPDGQQVKAAITRAGSPGTGCTGLVSAGAWTCSVTLPDGAYTATAAVIEITGAAGTASPATPFTVSTGAACGSTLAQTASPSNLSRPRFSGTAAAGSIVSVCEGGPCGVGDILLCSAANVPAGGAWSCAPAVPLLDGVHTVTAVARSPGGALVCPSNADVFTIDTLPPPPPGFDAPAPSRAPLLGGSGIAGLRVEVRDGTGALLCAATVDPAGRWSCQPAALAPGSYTLSAVQIDLAQNASAAVTQPLVVAGAPSLDQPTSPRKDPIVPFAGLTDPGSIVRVLDGGGATLCTAQPAGPDSRYACATAPLPDGSVTATAIARSTGGLDSPRSAAVVVVIDSTPPPPPLLDQVPSPTAQHNPLFSGTAEAGSTVTVSKGATVLCVTVAGPIFSCSAVVALPNGVHTVTARAADPLGNLSALSAAVAFTIDDASAAPPLLDPLAPAPGAEAGFTPQPRPTFTGQGVPGDTVTVRVQAGAALCTALVGSGGRWTCASSAALTGDPPTQYTVEAVQQAPAGGLLSGASAPISFTVDTRVPAAPLLSAPATPTSDRRPLFSGTAQPIASVEVDDATRGVLCTAVSSAAGSFSCQPTSDLAPGAYALTAKARGRSGLIGPASAPPRPLTEKVEDPPEGGSVRGGCQSSGVPLTAPGLLGLLLLRRRRRSPRVAGRAGMRSGSARSGSARAPFAAAAVALVLLAAPAVNAQQVDLGRFRPALGADGLAATEGARPPIEGEPALSAHVWLDGAYQPLVFLPSSGGRQVLVQDRFGGVASVQARLFRGLSLGLQVPLLLGQTGDLSALPASARPASGLSGGLGDLRIVARLGMLRQESAPVDLAVQAALSLPTSSAQSLSGDGGAQGEALLAAGRRVSLLGVWDLDLIGNVLVRVRREGQIGDVRTGSEVGLRGGVAWIPPGQAALLRRLFVETEALGYLRSGFSTGSLPAEWRAGLSLCAGPISLELAGGTALGSGVGAPRARFVFGAGFAPAACGLPERLHSIARGAPLAQQPASVTVTTIAVVPGAPAPAAAPAPASAPAPAPASASASPPLALAALKPTAEVAGAYIAPASELDSDGDGVPDSQDQCPLLPGPASLHGCPAAKTVNGDLELEALPPALPGADPGLPSAPLVHAAASGADADGDGVPDPEDSCPTETGTASNHGCPAGRPMWIALRSGRIELLSRIDFTEGGARLAPRASPALAQLAGVLRAHPELHHVEVQAHTDNALAAAAALALSQARAEAVVQRLVREGVEASRLSAKGYGSERPLAPNVNQRGRHQNVRIELRQLGD